MTEYYVLAEVFISEDPDKENQRKLYLVFYKTDNLQ